MKVGAELECAKQASFGGAAKGNMWWSMGFECVKHAEPRIFPRSNDPTTSTAADGIEPYPRFD